MGNRVLYFSTSSLVDEDAKEFKYFRLNEKNYENIVFADLVVEDKKNLRINNNLYKDNF